MKLLFFVLQLIVIKNILKNFGKNIINIKNSNQIDNKKRHYKNDIEIN